MKPNTTVIKLAKYEANQSTHKFRVGAIFYKGKTILGRGFNNGTKTHPKSPHPYKSIHAEFSAFLHSYRLNNDLNGASLYVHRILANGDKAMAKPCEFCSELLTKINVLDVWWSI